MAIATIVPLPVLPGDAEEEPESTAKHDISGMDAIEGVDAGAMVCVLYQRYRREHLYTKESCMERSRKLSVRPHR